MQDKKPAGSNAIKPGTDIIREFTVKKLRELAGRDLSMAKYPVICYFDEPRFQMQNLAGIESINNEALKELSVNNCRLGKLVDLDCFVKLKRLWASNNNIKKVQINFAKLEVLDVSKNGLFEIPDMSGCPNLKELDCSKNKIRGVWVNLLTNTKLEKIDLRKNKLKWKPEEFERVLGIMQGWGGLTELNFMGNKVHKSEGYRYYMATYGKSLKLLDAVELDGDDDEKNKPLVALKVKPYAEIVKYYELRAKVLANPDLMKKPDGNSTGAAKGDDDEDEEAAEGEGEEEEEDLGPHVRVLMTDLSAQLAKCFEGPKVAQQVMKRLETVIDKLIVAAPEHRVIFEKGSEPAELLEDFLQTIVVVLEKDDSVIASVLTILTKMLTISNQGVGARCLVQLKDLLLSSAKYGDVGIELVLEICVPMITGTYSETSDFSPLFIQMFGDGAAERSEKEKDLLITSLYEMQHEDVTAGLGPVVKYLCDMLKSEGSKCSHAVFGLLGGAAADENLHAILRKEKIMNNISDMLKEVNAMRNNKKLKLGQAERDRLKQRFEHLLLIIGGMAENDIDAAMVYAKKGVHVELLTQMSSLLQDVEALQHDHTFILLGQMITCISGLCNDPAALEKAMSKNFLEHLVEILARGTSLPCQLVSACYRSLAQILKFSVPPDPTEGIDDMVELTVVQREKKKREAIREAAATDYSEEPWMAVRIQINEVLEGVTPMLPYLGGEKYASMCRKVLNEVPPLYRLTNREILDVIASVVELLAFYGARAEEVQVMDELDEGVDEEEVPLEDRTFTTYVLDQNAQEICTELDECDRDNLLFSLLEVPDDNVRLAAVKTLKAVPLSNFDTAEVAKLIKCVADVDDPSAGRSEEVLAGLFSILTRFASLPATHRQGIDFRKKFSRSIFVILDILGKICANDARGSKNDLEEKEILTDAAVEFLQSCSKWREAPMLMGTREAIAKMKEILFNEDRFGDEGRPARIEATGVGGSVRSLMKVYEEQGKTGTVAARILNRISELMEGPYAAAGFKIEVESLEPKPANTWQRQLLTRKTDTVLIQEKRFEEQRNFFHLDAFKVMQIPMLMLMLMLLLMLMLMLLLMLLLLLMLMLC